MATVGILGWEYEGKLERNELATINDTLVKLDHSFSRVRQFTADASHELRTPLAAIRSVGEVALRSDAGLDDCRETIASILEEVDRMTHLVEDLLVLARADSKTFEPVTRAENLKALAEKEISLFSVLAEEKEQIIHTHLEEDCPVLVDQQILRLGIGNLLGNAIKFTPAGKDIRINLLKGSGECCLEIADSGPGISPHFRCCRRFSPYRQEKRKVFGRYSPCLSGDRNRSAVKGNL